MCVCVYTRCIHVRESSVLNAADAGECRQKPGMKGLLGWEVQSSVIGNICVCVCVLGASMFVNPQSSMLLMLENAVRSQVLRGCWAGKFSLL